VFFSAVMAFVHHCAAFTLVASLGIEVALRQPPLTIAVAQRMQKVDLLFGISAAVALLVGLLRVTFFEKGSDYYWDNAYFLTKFLAFLVAGLISIYPTLAFFSWRRSVRSGSVPSVQEHVARRLRLCLGLETLLIIVVLGCAALMARGFGTIS